MKTNLKMRSINANHVAPADQLSYENVSIENINIKQMHTRRQHYEIMNVMPPSDYNFIISIKNV